MLSYPGSVVAVAMLGLVFGSFVTALSYRLPRGQSIAAGRSRCSSCGTALGVLDLVPVLSWLARRGRCGHCGASVSWRYPAIELATMVLCLSALPAAGSQATLVVLLICAPLLVAIAVIDLEHCRLPNVLVIVLVIAMFMWRWTNSEDPIPSSGIAIAQGLVTFTSCLVFNWIVSAVTSRTAIGPADSKLMAAAAVGLPLWQFVIFLGLLGLVATMFGLAWQAVRRQPEFPLGASYLVSLWICLCWPDLERLVAS